MSPRGEERRQKLKGLSEGVSSRLLGRIGHVGVKYSKTFAKLRINNRSYRAANALTTKLMMTCETTSRGRKILVVPQEWADVPLFQLCFGTIGEIVSHSRRIIQPIVEDVGLAWNSRALRVAGSCHITQAFLLDTEWNMSRFTVGS